MRFEQSIDIDAARQRVWDVLSDLEAWPRQIETVHVVELLTPGPITVGDRVHVTRRHRAAASTHVRRYQSHRRQHLCAGDPAAAIVVMTRETVHIRYTIGDHHHR